MERKPIGLTVPYREVGYKEKSGWVGLTDEEISSVAYNNNPLDGVRTFARAIEKLLKEKNAQKK